MITRASSPYRAVYSALVTRLTRAGVDVGGTAGYPRIEVHSIVEAEPLDKNSDLRTISLTVESMTTDSMVACAELNSENMQLLKENLELGNCGWKCFGIVTRQIQDLVEEADTQDGIFRLILSVDVFTQTAEIIDTENN